MLFRGHSKTDFALYDDGEQTSNQHGKAAKADDYSAQSGDPTRRIPQRNGAEHTIWDKMPEVFAQIRAAHSRDTCKDEENRANHVDQVAQTTQVMRTGQEVLDPLPNPQAMFPREQDFTPM